MNLICATSAGIVPRVSRWSEFRSGLAVVLAGAAVGISGWQLADASKTPEPVQWEYATYATGVNEIPVWDEYGFSTQTKPFAYWETALGRKHGDDSVELEKLLGVKDGNVLSWAGRQGWELVTLDRELDGKNSIQMVFKRRPQAKNGS